MGFRDFWGFGVRHIQMLLLLSCSTVNHLLLSGLDAVIVMVESEVVPNSNYTLYEDTFRTTVKSSTFMERNYLVHTIYYSRITGYLIGGILSVKANPKITLMISSLALSLMPYVIPTITRKYGYKVLYLVRLYQGTFYGLLWPTLAIIVAKWVPYTELARSMSLIVAAPVLGQCFIVMMGKFLQTSVGGWSSLFYISGNVGILWVVAWFTFGFPDPHHCFYITPEEKYYIDKLSHEVYPLHKGIKIPWKEIIKCKPFYGCLFEALFSTWAYEFAKSSRFFQTYLINHLNVSEDKALYYVNLVPVTFVLDQLIVATVVDIMCSRESYPIIYLRKTCNTIGLWGSSICLFFICYVQSGTAGLIFYNLMLLTTAFANVGSLLTHFDLSPNFAGFLLGFSKTIGNLPMLFANFFLNSILTSEMQKRDWCHYYFIAGVSLLVGNYIYTILANDDLQKFNRIVVMELRASSVSTLRSSNSSP